MADAPSPSTSAAQPWRLTMRLVGLVLIVAAGGFWISAGANRGWTRTKVPSTQVDEVTAIEYTVYEDRFVPGIELLGAALLVGLAVIAVTFAPRPPRSQSSS